MKPTSLVMHSDCGLHDTGWGHPEHKGRLPAVVKAIYEDTPALLEVMLQEEAVPVEETDILRVHTPGHLERIRRAVEEATESRSEERRVGKEGRYRWGGCSSKKKTR